MTAGKLVRDRIPDLISAEGRTPKVQRLKGSALHDALYDKLAEEQGELLTAATPDAKKEELADMIEILIAIASMHGFDQSELMDAVARKRAERGGFSEGLFYMGDN